MGLSSPPSAPSGTSVPINSWIFAGSGSLAGTNNIKWSPLGSGSSRQGTDLSLSESVPDSGDFDQISFDADGLYVPVLDLFFTQTADADGSIGLGFLFIGDDNVPYGQGPQDIFIPVRPTAATGQGLRTEFLFSLPPCRFLAVDTPTISVLVGLHLAAGDVTIGTDTSFYVSRVG